MQFSYAFSWDYILKDWYLQTIFTNVNLTIILLIFISIKILFTLNFVIEYENKKNTKNLRINYLLNKFATELMNK
ncbi:hypothetical protein UDIV_5130 [Ureaplasma diversum NCTC 246]|uniref:Uncharacterized protein n=1 Tax=Ureaplasma diversum NCTC 246 TaxID=1188241 RepID=A0A084EXL4_9BACT|nr:hypothetical protein UDIV_5130 [Ureaplasma diversum NCTC 246]